MLDRFADKLRELAVQRKGVDPAHFDDPVALLTEWHPTTSGGTNFRTHRLVERDSTRAEFRPTVTSLTFSLAFLLIGLGQIGAVVYEMFFGSLPGLSTGSSPALLIGGAAFSIGGGWLLYKATAPIVFDLSRGEYWKGRAARDGAGSGEDRRDAVRLDHVHALQLVAGEKTAESSVHRLELNLVLEDGDRTMVLGHGDWEKLRNDAHTLSAKLGKPLWDATVAPRKTVAARRPKPTSHLTQFSEAGVESSIVESDEEGTGLERLASTLAELTAEPSAFAPADLDDPIAQQTKWGPTQSEGASFRTHKLVQASGTRAVFRPEWRAVAFYLLPLTIGVLIVASTIFSLISGGSTQCLAIPFGMLFAFVGWWLLKNGTIPVVFDVSRGEYWKGRKPSNRPGKRTGPTDYTELDRIYALQIISDYHSSKDSSHFSYELNLVLDDATRMHVVEHGDRRVLREDAQTLSTLIGKPLWDATRRS